MLKYKFGAALRTGRVAILCAAAAFLAACSGTFDPDDARNPETKLTADATAIFADGVQEVTFSVFHEGADVTAEAKITNTATGEELTGNKFKTATPGDYTFSTVYNEIEAAPLKITAKEATLVLGADFEWAEDGTTRNFTLKASYGSIDESKSADLKVFETFTGGAPEVELTAANKNAEGYFFVTTTGENKRTFYAKWTHATKGELTSEAKIVGPFKFYKNVGIFYLTGTWCTYCPVMAGYIKEAAAIYPDRQVQISVHGNSRDPDPMATTYTHNLITSFFKQNTLPMASLDFGPVFPHTVTNNEDMANRIRTLVEVGPAPCGIEIDATKIEGNTLTATVRLMTERNGSYGLMAALVESNIIGFTQTMPSGTPADPNYVHDHVLRKVADDGSVEGVPLGEVQGGKTVTRNFTFDLSGFNPANCTVVVFATTGSGFGTGLGMANAAECKVGQTLDFRYEEL